MCLICLMVASIDVSASDSPVAPETLDSEEAAVEPESDPQEGKLSENDKINAARLKKLLNITLVGIVLSDAGKSVAIIEDNRSDEQKFYRPNDWIRGGRIIKILKDRVVILKNGVDIELRINSGTNRGKVVPIAEKSYDNTENIQIASPDSKMAEVEEHNTGFPKVERKLLESIANAVDFSIPVTTLDDGRFRVDNVQPDSALFKLGLRNGDVISRVNALVQDKDVSFSQAVAQGLEQNLGKNIIRLEIERDGDLGAVYFEIEDSSEKQDDQGSP